MTVKEGREEEFVRVCKALTEKVHAKETPVYFEFFKLREPRRYAVLESFATEAEEHAHMHPPWPAELGPTVVTCRGGHLERQAPRDFQRRFLLDTLRPHRFKVAEAADSLGLTRPALYVAAKRMSLDLVAERDRWAAESTD